MNSGRPAAQEPFLRGVLLLHSFEYEDAREAFREARAIDPGFALAAWGEAMTHNHPLWRQQDREAAKAALESLGATPEERLAAAPTEREKAFLRAVEALFLGSGSKEERDRAYERAMSDLVARWPDDLEARAFWSLSILGTAQGARDFGVYMHAAAVAEEVFAANPRHPGAAHYLIHSYDDPIHAPLGLRAARVYAEIAPAASHAQHMISHIYVALGRWEESIAANEASYRVSAERAREKGLGVDTHNFHALHWLQYSHLQRGEHEAAGRLLERMRAMAEASRSPRALGYHAAMRAAQAVETDRPAGEPIAVGAEEPFDARVHRLFARGWLSAEAGDDVELGAAAAALREATPASSSGDGSDVYTEVSETQRENAAIMGLQLQALARRQAGDLPGAVDLLLEAATREAALPLEYGPPSVVKPSHELLGEALLAAGRAAEALQRFDEALARAPRRRLALGGRAKAAAVMGRDDLVETSCGELRDVLEAADPEIALPLPCGGAADAAP
jgi:tetratricopeptide (TPR) repeat protein